MEAIVLAAGWGQLVSGQSKLVHPLNGMRMVEHVLHNLNEAGFSDPIIVIGAFREEIQRRLGNRRYALQLERKGTAEAVWQACQSIANTEHLLVVCGDMPLISSQTLRGIVETHQAEQATVTLATLESDDPYFQGYSKILRNPSTGQIMAVAKGLAGSEVDAGPYCLNRECFLAAFPGIEPDAKGEYSLPSIVQVVAQSGHKIAAYPLQTGEEAFGINDIEQYRIVQKILARRGS